MSAETLDQLHRAGDTHESALQADRAVVPSDPTWVSFASPMHMLDDDDDDEPGVFRSRKRKQPGRRYEGKKRVHLPRQPLRPQDRERLLATDRLVEGLERCQCADSNCIEAVTVGDYRSAMKRNLAMTRDELCVSICEELRGFARSGDRVQYTVSGRRVCRNGYLVLRGIGKDMLESARWAVLVVCAHSTLSSGFRRMLDHGAVPKHLPVEGRPPRPAELRVEG